MPMCQAPPSRKSADLDIRPAPFDEEAESRRHRLASSSDPVLRDSVPRALLYDLLGCTVLSDLTEQLRVQEQDLAKDIGMAAKIMDEGAALLPSFSLVRGALLRKHIEDDEMRIAAAYQRLHGGMSMRFSRPSTEGGVKTPNDPELQPREFVIPVFPQDASPPATNRPPGRIARLVSFFTSQPNSAPPTGRGGVSPLTTDSSHQEQARENT